MHAYNLEVFTNQTVVDQFLRCPKLDIDPLLDIKLHCIEYLRSKLKLVGFAAKPELDLQQRSSIIAR